MTGTSASDASALIVSSSSNGPEPGRPRSSTTHATLRSRSDRQRLVGGRRRPDLDVVAAEQLGDRVALGGVVLDQQQRAHGPLGELLDALQHRVERLCGQRLLAGSRPRRPPCCRAAGPPPDTTCTGMWRVSGCRFRCCRSTMPSTSGRPRSSTIASGRNSSASARPASPVNAAQHAVAARPRRLDEQRREGAVVLDHQQHAVARRERVAIVAELVRQRLHGRDRHRGLRRVRAAPAGPPVSGRPSTTGSGLEGQEQREGRALAGHALHRQRAAEQPRELARDGEPEAGAAVAAAGRAVGLLEGLEDQRQLVRRDADAGVEHGERREPLGPRRAVARPAGGRATPPRRAGTPARRP